jgi:uncharacterized protein YbjT (DUF2867 family)
MKRILITGATGNVGEAVIHALIKSKEDIRILAGTRKPLPKRSPFNAHQVIPVRFNFEAVETVRLAVEQADILFLIRPPQLSDVRKYFKPAVDAALKNQIEQIVFLSVQGAAENAFIPHHKIEKLIMNSTLDFTMLRPAYFMQNFTTSLKKDLIQNNLIYLPAGNAKFTLIDVADVGQTAAKVLLDGKKHRNRAYDLTNTEQLSFTQMADQLSEGLGRRITYKSPNLVSFYLRKKSENLPTSLILVMIMLHFLPRFKKAPQTSNWVRNILQREPTTFREFIQKNASELRS